MKEIFLLIILLLACSCVQSGVAPFDYPVGIGKYGDQHEPVWPNPSITFCFPDMWTRWFDVDDSTGVGDYETLALIREKYPETVCNNPINVEGRVTGTMINAKRSNQRISIDKKTGLICKNVGQICLDYEVRFCCTRAPRCDGGKWTEFISVDEPNGDGDFETLWNVRLADPSVCSNPTEVDARRIKDGLHWSVIGRGEISPAGFSCKNAVPYPFHKANTLHSYQCDNYEVRFCCPRVKQPQCGPLDWTPWLNIDTPFDGCDVETLPRLCQKYPDLVCENPTAMDVRDVLSGKSFIPGPSIEASLSTGFKCCNRNGKKCPDYEVRFCCPKKPAPIPDCSETWTRFFDLDDPNLKGDYELLGSLRTAYPEEICARPLLVDARAVGTYSHFPIVGQVVELNLKEGLICENAKQSVGKCLDYEVRFCCHEELPATCAEEDWTEFYNIDNSTESDLCDCEDLASTREQHPGLCPNPTAMEVRLADGSHISTVNQLIHTSLSDGFRCYNFEQTDGETCYDYKVRYCCSVSVCPECQEFDECGTPCPDTCYNWNSTIKEECPADCVAGCRCSFGFVRNHRGDCVKPSDCTCPIGFENNHAFLSPTCDSACHCVHGVITCVAHPSGCPGPCVDQGDGTGFCLPNAFPAVFPPPLLE